MGVEPPNAPLRTPLIEICIKIMVSCRVLTVLRTKPSRLAVYKTKGVVRQQ